MAIPRRTIAELIMRYRLEPKLKDIYVEGGRDRVRLAALLKSCGCPDNISIFEVETVSVDSELLKRYGLTGGNRARVMALAWELERDLMSAPDGLICLADSDANFVLNNFVETRYLWFTDYSSLDMYFWNEPALSDAFQIGFGRRYPPGLWENICTAATQIFYSRATIEALGWNLRFIGYENCLRVTGESIQLDVDKMDRRLLTANNRIKDLAEFLAMKGRLMAIEIADLRESMKVEDCLMIVGSYLTRKRIANKAAGFGNPLVLSGVVFRAPDMSVLCGEGLIQRLKAKYGCT